MAPAHVLPGGLPQRLDLREPPADPAKARGYRELAALLEELGRVLDRPPEQGAFCGADLRNWEARVVAILRPGEIDLLMHPPEDDDYNISRLPEQRWQNLRSILLKRKGLG